MATIFFTIKSFFMEWMNTVQELPIESGPYLVSVKVNKRFGVAVFKYVAHFDSETNNWYKYDPFNNDYEPTELISEGEVLAWGKNFATFIR